VKTWRLGDCKCLFHEPSSGIHHWHRALDSLFATLKAHGRDFPVEFWDTVCQELLFPIFAVLKSSQDMSRFNTQEDMSVWLQTTMIQALRDLIDLYTFHFDILERSLDGLLDLLCVCICQGVWFE
jgi:brefeldin A-inhibited guanine nucleotide-exchange protein